MQILSDPLNFMDFVASGVTQSRIPAGRQQSFSCGGMTEVVDRCHEGSPCVLYGMFAQQAYTT